VPLSQHYLGTVLGVTPDAVTRLRGGYRNEVVRVRTDQVDVVVKRFVEAPENPMFPTLATHERAALLLLDGTGLAPTPVDAPDRDGDVAVLVYRWVEGPTWPGSARPPDRPVDATAHTLAAVHAVRASNHDEFRPLLIDPDDLVEHGRSMLAAAPSDLADRWRDVAKRWHRRHARASGARDALVHTDCGPGNQVLADGPGGPRVVLIDWQCPGLGDPVDDVATFLSPAMHVLYGVAPLHSHEATRFLAAYDPAGTVDAAIERRAAYHLRIAAYCAHRSGALAETDPPVASRYRTAFLAECDMLDQEADARPPAARSTSGATP
jgi:thiamine kinase